MARKAIRIQRDLLTIAADNQLRHDQMSLKTRKERIESLTGKKLKEIRVNDLVTVSYPDDKPTHKLKSKRRCPYRVIELHSNIATLLNLSSAKSDELTDVHINRLELFNYSERDGDLQTIANKDENEATVEKIVEMRGDINAKRSLLFLVKWANRPQKYNSFLNWRELRLNTKLHKFLSDNGWGSHIPKSVTENVNSLTIASIRQESDH